MKFNLPKILPEKQLKLLFISCFLNLIYIFSSIAVQSVFVLHELCKKTKAPKTNCLRQSYFLTGEIFYVYSNLFSASTYKYNLAQLRKFFIDLHIFDVFVFLCSTDRKRFHIVLIFVPPRKFLYHIVRNQYIYSQIDQHKTVYRKLDTLLEIYFFYSYRHSR